MLFLQTCWGNERRREKPQPGSCITTYAAAAAVDWDAVSLRRSPLHRGHVCQPETTFNNHQMKAASPATAVNLMISFSRHCPGNAAELFSAERYGSKQKLDQLVLRLHREPDRSRHPDPLLSSPDSGRRRLDCRLPLSRTTSTTSH